MSLSRRRRLPSLGLPLAALCLAALCLALPCAGQSVTRVTLSERDGDRDTVQERNWISLADCLEDGELSFGVSYERPNQEKLEVWVSTGDDCTLGDNRTGGTVCWRVYEASDPGRNGQKVELRAQDLVSHNAPGSGSTGPGTEEDCLQPHSTTPQQLSIFFLLISGSDAVAGYKWTETGYDLKGPEGVTDLKVEVAEEVVQLSWTAPEDQSRSGYVIYCDPPPGGRPAAPLTRAPIADAGADSVATDGGATTAATTTATGPTLTAPADNPDCRSAAFTSGEPLPDEYRCGEVSAGTHTKGQTEVLPPGSTYAVAVAGVDSVGNAGALSPIVCATPVEVTDFFEDYHAQGGPGGGGFCALDSGQSGAGGSLALFTAGALGVGWSRREGRRRGSRRRSRG